MARFMNPNSIMSPEMITDMYNVYDGMEAIAFFKVDRIMRSKFKFSVVSKSNNFEVAYGKTEEVLIEWLNFRGYKKCGDENGSIMFVRKLMGGQVEEMILQPNKHYREPKKNKLPLSEFMKTIDNQASYDEVVEHGKLIMEIESKGNLSIVLSVYDYKGTKYGAITRLPNNSIIKFDTIDNINLLIPEDEEKG